MSEDLTNRVGQLEQDVSSLKVETAKIGTTLIAMKETSDERHTYVAKSLDKIDEKLEALCAPTAKTDASATWMKEIITPQTIALVLAIVLSAFGGPVVAQQMLNTASTINPIVETAPSPSTQP